MSTTWQTRGHEEALPGTKALTSHQQDSLLGVIRILLPDAGWNPVESWDGQTSVEFVAQCQCRADEAGARWPATLTFFVEATMPPELRTRLRLRKAADLAVEQWCDDNLKWAGCKICNRDLVVEGYYFAKEPQR